MQGPKFIIKENQNSKSSEIYRISFEEKPTP